MTKPLSRWKKIKDSNVRHLWVCAAAPEDCEFGNPEAYISPDFYEESGEPVCECDQQMAYVGTEIRT